MAKIPNYLLTRPITPGWVYTVEALVLALLVHGALFFLAGYQPEKRTPPARKSPGVTLLTRSGLPEEEWRKLLAWTLVHDSAQISRSDAGSGYTALLEKHRERAVAREADDEAGIPTPQLPELPGYAKLALIPAEEPEPYCGGLFDERKPVPVPAVRAPFITDGDGKRLELRRLRLPGEVDRNAVVCPTVITVRGGGGMMRQHLAQSCGVAALDQAALEAIAGEREALHGTIVVYWPEMESEEVAP